MEGLNTIRDFDFKGKKVLLRTDFNVPLKEGEILDDFRIRSSLSTIKTLLQKGALQIIIVSHLGRPEGKDLKFSLRPVAKHLFKLTGRKVFLVSEWFGKYAFVPGSEEYKIVMLENIRFWPEEKSNDEGFAKNLASLADVYVNDAFGVCHRKDASVHAVTNHLPSCIGLLVEKELKVFDELLSNPDRPFTAVLGGAKLETKIPVIQNLLPRVDHVLIGGGMIFTFYSARGFNVGRSLIDKKNVTMAKFMLNNEKIVLPVDVVIADDRDAPSNTFNVFPDNIPTYMAGLDIGEKAIEQFKAILKESKTVMWNGPLGYYENPEFAKATNVLLKFLAGQRQIKVVVGGGDTATMVEGLGLRDKFYHVSTGGGASVALIEGKTLPALEAIKHHL